MPRPILYHGNLLLSGSVSGTQDSSSNPVRKVRDGSVNLPYTVTADVAGIQSGSVTLQLTVAASPDAFVLPRCDLLSGHTITLESMDDLAETNLATVHTVTLTSATEFYLQELASPTARKVWRLEISGATALAAQGKVHEFQLADKYQLPRSPEVNVARTRVRQFTRLPIPGGQPFVKRDGPRLRQNGYSLVILSGSEVDTLRNFVDTVEGGQAFTMTDDLQESYWAELLSANLEEEDEAGVSRVTLQFQEIKAG